MSDETQTDGPTPDIHADIVAQVIFLARETRDPETGGPDADEQLKGFIANLTDDEKLDLVAIMWIGRDSFSVDEWEEARETAQYEQTNATEEYLANTPLLADYLEAGLEALNIPVSDAEDGIY